MNHDPSNPNCDRNQFPDAPADEVHCTCDVDEAPLPSTSLPPGLVTPAASPGSVLLTGRVAQTHRELEAATREFRAAQQLLKPAEERWRRAMDAHMEAIGG